jgi:helix-turn-helix protein
MLDIFYKNDNLVIVDSNKKDIVFDYKNNTVLLDGYDVTFP